MKTIITIAILVSSIAVPVIAQTQSKKRVYGEIGMGFGQTLFMGDIKQKLGQALGGTFEPGMGNNLMMAFYVAPEKWKGLGIGSRIKGTFGTSVDGDTDNDSYIFNYYNLGLSAKYYFISREYNKGFYTRAGIGFGQFTAKRFNETNQTYLHQYAIGSTASIGAGYSFPLKSTSLSIEAEFERSSRNGTINGVGDAQFTSGQLGANVILTF